MVPERLLTPAVAVTSLASCPSAGRKGQQFPRGSAGLGHGESVCVHWAWLHSEISNCTRSSAKPGAPGIQIVTSTPAKRHSCAAHTRTRAEESCSSPVPRQAAGIGQLLPVGSEQSSSSSSWIYLFLIILIKHRDVPRWSPDSCCCHWEGEPCLLAVITLLHCLHPQSDRTQY